MSKHATLIFSSYLLEIKVYIVPQTKKQQAQKLDS